MDGPSAGSHSPAASGLRRAFDQRGATGAGVLVAIGALVVLVAAAWVGLGVIGTSTDEHGRVGVPGDAQLQLPEGEVDIFYAEDIDIDGDLVVPFDLQVQVADPRGETLEVRRRSGHQVSGGRGTATLYGSIDVTVAGSYRVVTRSELAGQRQRPEVTLGESPFDALTDRAEEVLDVVRGPGGIGLIVILLLAGLAIWARSRSELPGPTLPGR